MTEIINEQGNEIFKTMAEFSMLPRALRPQVAEMLGRLNISRTSFYRLMNDERTIALRKKLSKRWFSNYVPDVVMAMRNEALAGNERAAKIFLEYVGELEDKGVIDDDDAEVTYEEVKIVLKKLRVKRI